ncbi:MAG: signal transduction protein [Actinobacteria bacterium 13_2_20CM_2_71_6]|nr:MAG: signal transduction protein [Actinobacteria bacterium 13_2_20CM_2_71_6]
MAALTVGEIMTRDVVRLQVDTTIDEAARVMRDQEIGDVVVVDNDRLVGVVTDRDIVVRGVAEGHDPRATTLGSVVSKDLVTVRPGDTLQEAALLMRDRAVRRVLVRDENGLVGIVSIGDLAVDLDPESVLGGISGADPNN